MFRLLLLCVLINIGACRIDLYQGDACTKGEASGTCVEIGHCPQAIDEIKRKMTPQICSFKDATPVVCCVNHTTSVSTTPLKTTTEATSQPGDDCEPIPINLTVAKTGRKAWDKCVEYQQLVYPCGLDDIVSGTAQRLNLCQRDIGILIIRGTEASKHEFPHMVRLSTTAEDGKMEWIGSCAGALISDRYVLTTAHCTTARGQEVTQVILDSKMAHAVKGVTRHPDYHPPKSDNDIALLELEKPVVLDEFRVPACLPVVDEELRRVVITGWDLNFSKNPDALERIIARQVPVSVCTASLPPRGVKLTEGGHHTCIQDWAANYTCLGSGDILQVESKHNHCMHEMVGMGSLAGGCNGLGAYTTVARYVAWIEEIVWK